MKITLFTSNLPRHNYLINLLSEIASELFVVQEKKNVSSKLIPGNYPSTSIIKNYFSKVIHAENILFGNSSIMNKNKNVNLLSVKAGELNKYSIDSLKNFLDSSLYIVFGSSYIKGDLIKFLIKKKTVNIHMGVSPYYRGSDCNFWALYDNNPNFVGATIHLLSEGLDSGPILYHALSEIKDDPFIYTMSTVKSAFCSLAERIKNETILKIKEVKQDKKKQIRYSRKNEFVDKVVSEYLEKEINLNKKFKLNDYKEPYILKS